MWDKAKAQCVDVMPHQMKGIGNGRQDVCFLIPNTWKNIRQKNNEVGSNFAYLHYICKTICHFLLLVLVNANKVLWIFSSKPFFCFWGVILQISKELNIDEVFQFVINQLMKKYHLNVNVQKGGSTFAKCIVCESLKDLISKVRKNSASAKEHEFKLKRHNKH
jgi:hypothetical protein